MSNINDSKKVDETHKKFAKQCFNSTWDYLDKASLTPEEELKMLNLAHASRFHWSVVGTPNNNAVGDWQVSRVYAKLNEGKVSLKYAQSCLQLTLDNKIEELYLSAYEGIARAYAVLKDFQKAKMFILKAEEELKKVSDKEDREIYEPQITETKSMIE